SRKIKVHYFNLTKTDIGELAIHLVDSAVLLLGTPTVLTGPHPAAMNAAYLVNALRPKLKYIGVFGSYGWGGKTVERLKETLNNLKADLLQPVMVKGKPDSAGLKLLENMADEIQIKLKEFSHL
ncbi:MAG: FprA family A-type flavoprotein, partial [Thermoplasmata archaeon]